MYKKSIAKLIHLLHPNSGARLQASEYSQTSVIMRQVRLLDVHCIACRGLVMTTYRSIEMARRLIMEVIPNKAPQKAYILQPVEKKERRKHFSKFLLLTGKL